MPPTGVSALLPAKSAPLPLTVLFSRVSTVPLLKMPVVLLEMVEFEILMVFPLLAKTPETLPCETEDSIVMAPPPEAPNPVLTLYADVDDTTEMVPP